MTHILIVGSGARECFIIKKLIKDSDLNIKITCIGSNKNPYINKYTKLFISDINTINIKNLLNIIGKPDYAIIGPENPLKLGISDLLESFNIPCIGPLQLYSQIETSKIFARRFIDEIGLGEYSPNHLIVKTGDKIVDFLQNSTIKNLVIKKDGLHGGKGVLVQGIDFNSIDEIEDEFKNIDENILIEEKLEGEEFSLMSITDGNGNIAHFPPIKDYKRLNNNDLGPNTGSMGCIIDKNNTLPFLNDTDVNIGETINTKIINKLNEFGKKNDCKIGYRGILYGSFIKTKDGKIYIIEFNSRLGDPEGIIALNLLNTNFFNLCNQIVNKSLKNDLEFNKKAMIGIYLVPKTYPKKSHDKHDIYISDNINKQNMIYGNVEEQDNHLYSLSSRSLFYFTEGEDLGICYNKIYNEIKNIVGNFHFRTDIGKKYINSYDSVGVSIDRGSIAVNNIKQFIESTYTNEVLGKHGDFGGQFKLGEYVLVSSIDGVGTKSILAQKKYGVKSFINLGKDIVNHSVNDILVQGAFPLFFMDYYGTHSLDVNEITNFVKGMSEACIENGKFPILGGETAEMPGIYKENMVDLVGCIVGIKDSNFFKNPIRVGSKILGLKSCSPHTNGYSLINKIIEEVNKEYDVYNNSKIIERLLIPHKSYLNDVYKFVNKYSFDDLFGMGHITGGGLEENIKRVIPKSMNLELNYNIIKQNLPEWCEYLMIYGNISFEEMIKIYNCGIGYVFIVPSEFGIIDDPDYTIIGEIV